MLLRLLLRPAHLLASRILRRLRCCAWSAAICSGLAIRERYTRCITHRVLRQRAPTKHLPIAGKRVCPKPMAAFPHRKAYGSPSAALAKSGAITRVFVMGLAGV